MAFIEMIDINRNAQSTHSFYSADTEYDLLRDPFLAEPAVQLSSNPSIIILRDIRIQ
ncbi:hypothetical protein D3C78_1473300 [compost metagenome]